MSLIGLNAVSTALELKTLHCDTDQLPVLALGLSTVSDMKGGWFKWDANSTATADDLDVIQVIGVSTGRYLRVMDNSANGSIVRSRGGARVIYVGKYIIYCNSGTVAGGNGEVSYNLTDDGTPTGNALFTTVFASNCEPTINTTSAIAKGNMNRKSLSGDNKLITFTGSTGTTLAALGNTTVQIPNGTVCNCFIVGI